MELLFLETKDNRKTYSISGFGFVMKGRLCPWLAPNPPSTRCCTVQKSSNPPLPNTPPTRCPFSFFAFESKWLHELAISPPWTRHRPNPHNTGGAAPSIPWTHVPSCPTPSTLIEARNKPPLLFLDFIIFWFVCVYPFLRTNCYLLFPLNYFGLPLVSVLS